MARASPARRLRAGGRRGKDGRRRSGDCACGARFGGASGRTPRFRRRGRDRAGDRGRLRLPACKCARAAWRILFARVARRPGRTRVAEARDSRLAARFAARGAGRARRRGMPRAQEGAPGMGRPQAPRGRCARRRRGAVRGGGFRLPANDGQRDAFARRSSRGALRARRQVRGAAGRRHRVRVGRGRRCAPRRRDRNDAADAVAGFRSCGERTRGAAPCEAARGRTGPAELERRCAQGAGPGRGRGRSRGGWSQLSRCDVGALGPPRRDAGGWFRGSHARPRIFGPRGRCRRGRLGPRSGRSGAGLERRRFRDASDGRAPACRAASAGDAAGSGGDRARRLPHRLSCARRLRQCAGRRVGADPRRRRRRRPRRASDRALAGRAGHRDRRLARKARTRAGARRRTRLRTPARAPSATA